MTLVDTVLATVHLLVGALWVGSVVFFAAVIVPSARAGGMNASPLESMAQSLTRGSRLAAVVMLLTGGHLAASAYTFGSLAATTNGNLVVAMVVLWLALAGLVEVAGSRLRAGVEQKKVREPAAQSLPFYRGAAVVGVLLFLTAGALVT